MHAVDIMTSPVVSVSPETSIKHVARLLADRHISAVPVVDEKLHVLGMISEGDLMRRAKIGTVGGSSWWLDLFASTRELADDYVKTHSKLVRDVMTTEVVTASEHATLTDIAKLLETHHIKRVPVTRNGQLIGIVSRANLVQALAIAAVAPAPTSSPDREIRKRLMTELARETWADMTPGNIVVANGVVHLWGYMLSEPARRALCVAAENIPGVKSVEDHTRRPPVPPAL
jgi:CBS domain-containing protein